MYTSAQPGVIIDYVTVRHLCRWRLQRVVVQNDALQLCELSVTHRDGSHFITGEVQTNQRQICQL